LSDATVPTLTAVRSGSSGKLGDQVFAGLALGAALLVLALLGSIIVILFIGGWPAFKAFGPGFVTSMEWNPNAGTQTDDGPLGIYGAGVPIYGTLITSVLALLLAVPMAFGVAFFLTELAPQWMRRPVGTAIELLAAVPSIIYGMWGFFVIKPWIAADFETPLVHACAHIPVLNKIFAGGTDGYGIFTASLILAVMVLPFIAATMRDVFLTVPVVYKESAYGVGCTTWEVVRSVVLPYTKTAVVGGIMLGLGRALGETMAVTFVIGGATSIVPGLFSGGNTIASMVALQFPEAESGSLKLASLLALGFILFVISFIVLAVSRLMLRPKFKE